MLDDGGLLVGLEVGTVDVNGRRFIRSLRPVYRSPRGETTGTLHGESSPGRTVTLKAKDGFAIGGISVKGTSHIESLSITFMQLQGFTLDPRSTYSSPWVGTQGDAAQASGTEIHLGGSGSPVIGIAGRLSNVIKAQVCAHFVAIVHR